ncbi:MAG: hypothetical protein WBM78_01700, partial [Desulfobacterales bacterium]
SEYPDIPIIEPLNLEPWCETSRGWNSEQIERRTSNAQHRTLNIDAATLYRFYNKRAAEH